jgi:hypothetical protein
MLGYLQRRKIERVTIGGGGGGQTVFAPTFVATIWNKNICFTMEAKHIQYKYAKIRVCFEGKNYFFLAC